MKKKWLALLLAAAMVLGMLTACTPSGSNESPAPASNPGSEESQFAGDTGNSGSAGKVYYLNFKPEADKAWQDLAAAYTAETGVEVKVVTAASGTYSDTLTAEMAKTDAPTIFNIGNQYGMDDWSDYALDLTGAAFFDERTSDNYVMYDDNDVPKALGYCYESFGIIVNTALLETAGYTLADITDFASLKRVADDIHARAGELGFDAFSAPGLDGSSSWRFSGHLANVALYYEYQDENMIVGDRPAEIKGTYLDNYRNIWDLYITDTAANPTSLSTSTGDESEAEFGEGKAVFYQNGDWEYASLTSTEKYGMDPADLTMIPIYCGANGETNAGLNSGTENNWAVNAKASEDDIQASLDFLYWVVTSDAGTTMLAEQFSGIPFKSAKASSNVFAADAVKYFDQGKYTMTWAFNDTPNVDSWRATVVTALTAYSADPTDANWAAVKEAFVDGWAYEYNVVNG